MPACRYDVLAGRSGDGALLAYARVGDPVYHRWTCDYDVKGE